MSIKKGNTKITSLRVIGEDLSNYFYDSVSASGSNVSAGSWVNAVKKMPAFNFTNPNLSNFFYQYGGTEIDLSEFDTTNATNMVNMFNYCSNLKTLKNPVKFKTSNCTNFAYMFYNCINLENVPKLDLSNSTNCDSIFGNCQKLTSVEFDTCNNSQATVFSYMFYYNRLLTSLDLTNLTMSANNKNMYGMFRDCSNLTSIKIPNFTGTVYNCGQMFYNGYKFNNIDISGLDFTSCTNYSQMFVGVPYSCYILVKDQANKSWFNSKYSSYTNVHYVGEV